MNRIEKTTAAFIIPSYRFINKLVISSFQEGDVTSYLLTLYISPEKLGRWLNLNPNFISGTGKLKKDLLDRPFNSFTQLVDENDVRNVSVAKKLNQDIKKDFYFARKMSGIDYPSGLVSLRIVFD